MTLFSCFRFLATGESFNLLALRFKMGKSEIIYEACRVLRDRLQPFYLQAPNKEIGQFSNWIERIDGKYIRIECPLTVVPNIIIINSFPLF